MAEEKKMSIFAENADETNIQEVIEKAGLVTEEIAQKAAEEIASKRKEKMTQELITLVQKVDFIQKSTFISYKRSNNKNKAIKAYMKDLTDIIESVKNGKISINDWEEKARNLKKELNKKLNENDNECDTLQEKLNEIFPNSWSYRYSEFLPRG